MEVGQSHLQEVYINDICYLVGVVKELVVIKAILVYITCSFITTELAASKTLVESRRRLRIQLTQIFRDAETLRTRQ